MKYLNNQHISVVALRHVELTKMLRASVALSQAQLSSESSSTPDEKQPHWTRRAGDARWRSERERTLVHEPLTPTARQAKRLIRAAIAVDASIWRNEVDKLQAQGFTVGNQNWVQASMEKAIPWFECKAQLVLTTGMSFRKVLELTVGDLRLSECETRLDALAGHKLTDRCSALLEAVFPLGQLALFPWGDRAGAANLWLRACQNAGLLREHPPEASRRP